MLQDAIKRIIEKIQKNVESQESELPPPNERERLLRQPRKSGGLRDVVGLTEVKQELTRDYVMLLKNKMVAKQYHIMPPNGILLYGPPGCGKTFLAQKLAEETGMKYKIVKPSDLGSQYIHGTQGRIAEMFETAEMHAPYMLLLDEIDAMMPRRGHGPLGEMQANEVNEFLCQLNNCAARDVYVVGMTNRPDMIDEAITRSGRLERSYYISLPTYEDRRALLDRCILRRPHDQEIDSRRLAEMTENRTPSDIVFIVEEAARMAMYSCICQGGKDIVPITQNMLEGIIQVRRPSLTPEMLRYYEQLNLRYTNTAAARPRIGFQM